jgi:hypothetical protein
MNEATKQLKAAMEMESTQIDQLFAEMISDAGVEGALDFAKVLLLRDRCAMLLLAMTVEGVAANLDEAKVMAQQLLFHNFDLEAINR